VARTVIFGGLLNADMAEEVLCRAKDIDGVCSVTYPLPKEELQHHGESIYMQCFLFFWTPMDLLLKMYPVCGPIRWNEVKLQVFNWEEKRWRGIVLASALFVSILWANKHEFLLHIPYMTYW